MKDIKIDTPTMLFQYYVSWFGFICLGLFRYFIVWFIALWLFNYGKVTSLDVKPKKNVLNKTWQKFVFIVGAIFGDLFLLFIIGFLIMNS